MIQFLNSEFIGFEEKPARRQNKKGLVEAVHSAIRLLGLRLFQDTKMNTFCKASTTTKSEILMKATFLSNVLRGNKVFSSFELVRGYTVYP